jgi:hypothetical protein
VKKKADIMIFTLKEMHASFTGHNSGKMLGKTVEEKE